MKQVLPINNFFGGQAEGDKTGPLGSFKESKRLDIWSNPNKASPLPESNKASGSTVTDLIKCILPVGSKIYYYGDTGKFYSSNLDGTSWTLIDTLASSSGNGMEYFKTDDYIYLTTDKSIAKYGPISGTPSLTEDCFVDGTNDLDQSNDASGQTYSLTTAVNEGATHRQTFIPTKDSIRTIEVLIADKGTGNWTLTVHDADNNLVGSKTITSANLSNADVKFTFASDLRPIVGATYHFHIHSTVADGTVTSGTASDLEDVDYHEYFGVLIEDVDYHPVATILGILAFGNGPYIATWDGVTYDPNKINDLPLHLKIRTLNRAKEFLVGGTWTGSTIVANDEGFAFFWDGSSSSINFFSELGLGGVNAATTINGKTFMVVGSTSTLYSAYGVEDPEPLLKIPGMGDGEYIEILPGALDMWDGFLCIGVAGGGDSTEVFRGVWLYGTKNAGYDPSIGCAFTCSNNSDEQSTDVTIGAVKGVGRRLFFSWKDSTTYGVDMVLATGDPAATAEYGSLIFDDRRQFKKKKALTIIATHEALSGDAEGIYLCYKLDRASSWTDGDTNTTADKITTELSIPLTDTWYEIEIGFVLSSSGSNKTKLTSINLEYDDLVEEQKVG